MVVPILIDDKLMGIVSLYSRRLRHFDVLDKAFGEMIGQFIKHILSSEESLEPAILYNLISFYRQQRHLRISHVDPGMDRWAMGRS